MTGTGDRIIQSPVQEEYNGWRLDKYLAARFTYYSRSRWAGEIRSGKITKNGKPAATPHDTVRAGDVLSYDPGVITEPPVDSSYSVLFEDRYIIAVNKSGNLPIHPSGKFFRNTLLTILETDTGSKLHPLHRLDRETSGVVLFGKDPATASAIQQNIGSAEKIYVAVIRGRPESSTFTVSAPLGTESGAAIKKKQGTKTDEGKDAVTFFQVLYRNNDHSLIRARLGTGRYHQIRAHLEHAGFPIVGDKLYGGDQECYRRFVQEGYTPELHEKLGFHRTALHARSMKFSHPMTGKIHLVKAPLPDDLKGLITELFGL